MRWWDWMSDVCSSDLALVESEHEAVGVHASGDGLAADVLEGDLGGQQAYLGTGWPLPGRADLGDQVVDPVAEAARVGVGVDARRGCEEVVLAGQDSAAGSSGRHQLRKLAVDLGVEGVTQAQFEAGAEEVTQGGREVGPASGSDDQVYAEGGRSEEHPSELQSLMRN